MKINLNLSLKLTLIVFLVSTLTIISLTYINIQEQTSFFENAYSEKATALAQSLDASISSRSDLEDEQKLQNYLLNFILVNKEDILRVNIILPEENGDLIIAVSSDSDSVGNPSSSDNYISYAEDSVVSIPSHSAGSHTLTVIMPLHLSGQVVGTYEMFLSMNSAYTALNLRANRLIMISVTFLFFLVISFLYLLRKIVVKPIATFRIAIHEIGKGNLDTKINIKSRDELGKLASTFNHMTSNLKKSKEEIVNYSDELENKVEKRTKELDRYVGKLERNKYATLNMMKDLQVSQNELEILNNELERKVKGRTVEIEKLLKQKEEFIDQLGHDLKNPLGPLLNLVPLLEKGETDPERKEIFEILNRNTRHMKNLVTKTIQLAKLNSPDTKLSFEDANILTQIDNVIAKSKISFSENNIEIDNKIGEDIIVNADKIMISELFDNLIGNSVKYSPDGGNITIDAKQDKDFITVSIQDTGIGIAEEQIDHIFDEFYKTDLSRHDFDSSGLGLPIA
ncbi:MAG: ATP-binding protein, partial [Candidatus Heimdallarchaeaceae archaeon]